LDYLDFPLMEWTNRFIDHWLIPVFGPFFDTISDYISYLLKWFETILLWFPPEVLMLVFAAAIWRVAGKGVALLSCAGFVYIGSVGLWDETMQTMAIILSATVLSLVCGIPIGVLCAKSDKFNQFVRPLLDAMQTMPSFVYLIPTILLFGIGSVPAVISTFIFAMPPAVRLTNLGIRQVPEDVVEASQAFGSTGWQILRKVELPLARSSILAGVNQTIMMALSMAVIASMIGSGGLGSVVLTGITRVNVGLGLEAGLAIVFLAVILDRVTQSMGQRQRPQL